MCQQPGGGLWLGCFTLPTRVLEVCARLRVVNKRHTSALHMMTQADLGRDEQQHLSHMRLSICLTCASVASSSVLFV